MSYFKDTEYLVVQVSGFVRDVIRGFTYFLMGAVYFVWNILNVVFKNLPRFGREIRSTLVEIGYITNSLLYWLLYEVANLLSSFFLVLSKGCVILSDYFDRVARYLFPKSIKFFNE